MFLSQKKPLMIDMNLGIVGTFIRKQADPISPHLVAVYYVPLGGFREQKYPELVPDVALITINPTRVDIDGVAREIIFLKENAKGDCEIAQRLGGILAQSLKEYQERMRMKELEIMTSKHQANSALQESQKRVAQDMELKKRGEGDDRGGMRPSIFDRFRPPQNRYLGDYDD